MKIAIIGAGAAGLAGIRHSLEENVECVAFEQGAEIGGTWNYVENEEENVSVHSSMYAGLSSNLPTQLMEYENFHYSPGKDHYIPQSQVLEYIHEFAKEFNLLPYVKLNHQVVLVDSLPNEKWLLRVRNTQTNKITEETFDGVLICNGHYFEPYIPSIAGLEEFEGHVIHSHVYRKPDKYRGKTVLIIGEGFSGVDIYRFVGQVAKKVYLSVKENGLEHIPDEMIKKPIVSRVTRNKVIFENGTEEQVDCIIFCTGFKTVFPFLSENCQITVDENCVKPLYKHIINIEHPTMAIVNITYIVSPFPLFSIQIRFFLAYLKGHYNISKREMYQDYNNELKERAKKGMSKKLAHFIGPQMLEYADDLAKIANIRRIPPVIGKMFKCFLEERPKKCAFNVINDEEYEVIFV